MSATFGAGCSNHIMASALSFLNRQTLCVPGLYPGLIASAGAPEFMTGMTRHYEVGQSNAIERLLKLKEELRDSETEAFWKCLMEGIAGICNAQCSFVAQSNPEHAQTQSGYDTVMSTSETPEFPYLGVCLYYNDGQSITAMHRNYKYFSRAIPCDFMKHDKVYLIPENLALHMESDPNMFPFPMDAYLAVPLFSDGKCFAHFGLMWTVDGREKCDVSWAYLEMILHSMEDLVQHRLLNEQSYKKAASAQVKDEQHRRGRGSRASAYHSAAGAHSGIHYFKPYARSLSHELRTPMQGVVGMLDVMHANVQESMEKHYDPLLNPVFQELKDNIEAIQDSVRRAVEAADNIVHAYDLNMQVPETPENSSEKDYSPDPFRSFSGAYDSRPNILIEGSNITVNPYKRRRSSPVNWNYTTPFTSKSSELPSLELPRRELSPRSAGVKTVVEESGKIVQADPRVEEDSEVKEALINARRPSMSGRFPSSSVSLRQRVFPPMTLQCTRIREILQLLINESLHVGGRPDSALVEPTMFGQNIEIKSKSPDGRASTKIIQWSVDPSVPDVLYVDERDFTKLVSCVFINALKFTESGKITLFTKLNTSQRCVLIKISDTGTGIPEAFLPNLFQPFAREDDSTTRSREGLGLGLLVAKGLCRKLGGDLRCLRSSTREPDRGSEFEIRLPINPNDCLSRPGTPHAESSPPRRNSNISPGINTPTEKSKTVRNSPETPPLNISSNRPFPSTANRGATKGGWLDSPSRLPMSSRNSSLLSWNSFDRQLADKQPLTFLVAEDNKINRRILVNMLSKLGYNDVYEAFDGREAVRIMGDILLNGIPSGPTQPQSPSCRSFSERGTDTTTSPIENCEMSLLHEPNNQIPTRSNFVDVILMDLWMPGMDGYQATEKILDMVENYRIRLKKQKPNILLPPIPTVLAVSADVTDEALSRATMVGMEGYMTKPYKLSDLERLIVEFCGHRESCEK
ncbi:histidine kinase M7 [Paracoccidioides lutzii Pb01]|uniref:histidine kinase n=1 Tax=Paracoccidioides lutzii (strain ATCC MYA-826 / Pb01) TaxID=502779 RepID=C1GQH2_PARBA|nr:histidine kinase M7 [Paracoccidioides lutzii Pb01]EEH37846.2 histidine kinase M7 [Paracoccidioides lutzii Pb01]